MLTKTKMTIVAALVLGSASVAQAQSFDPDVGSGNIAPAYGETARSAVVQGAYGAYAQVPTSMAPRGMVRPVLPFTPAEKALFDRIPKE